jgi:hypothetical protein
MADLMVNNGLIGQTNTPCTEKNKKTTEGERNKNPSKEKESTLPVWEKEKAQKIIDECYDLLFSPQARRKAEIKANKETSPNPKQANLLLRLHDFATVIEADRAMKAGNIGQLRVFFFV